MEVVLYNSMRDLLTNIKKAIKIINESKNLTIHLTDPNAVISAEAPIGVSIVDWEKCLAGVVNDVLFTADDLTCEFSCNFNYDDLLVPESGEEAYTEAMKRIIRAIYDQYKYFKDLGSIFSNIGPQSIAGTKTYNNTGYSNVSAYGPLSVSQHSFSNMQVAGDLSVNGEIEADDIKVNGGQLSVSSELNDLKNKNQVLENELDALKALLTLKGVI